MALDLNDLMIFDAVATHGGVSAGARALNLPKSRISRRVAALEAALGVRLIERSTRRFKVTEVGQDVHRHARAAAAEAEAAEAAAARLRAEPQGRVRVSCPMGLDRLLAGCLPAFLAANPKVDLQVLVTNRRIDLIEEGVDVAIRVRERLDTDAELQVRILGRSATVLVASPGFLDAHGRPATPADLAGLPTLAHADRPGPDRWTLANAAGETVEVVHEPRLAATAFPLLRETAVAGSGVTFLPEYACRELIEAGALERVLPDWSLAQGILHMVFTSRRGLLPSVRATLDFLAEALGPASPAWAREAI